PGARRGAAVAAAQTVSREAPLGPLCNVELLAGRGRRRRCIELRDHRQAAVCVACRSDHRSAHRRDSRVRRRSVRRVPGAARDPRVAARARPTHPPPPRPWRAGRAGSAPPHQRLRRALRRVFAACAPRVRLVGGRSFFFGLTAIHFRSFDVYVSSDGHGPEPRVILASGFRHKSTKPRNGILLCCFRVFVFAWQIWTASTTSAQTPRDGTLLVTVVDQTRAVIPAATVTVIGLDDPTKATPIAPVKTKTSDQGVATITGVKPGRYLVQAEFPGF